MPRPQSYNACFLQFDVQLGDLAANLSQVEHGLARLQPEPPGIVLLPEMWAAGFDYARLREWARRTPEVLESLNRLVARYGVLIAGSLPEATDDTSAVYNTLFVSGPEGGTSVYRKQHLFAPIQEDLHFRPGDNPLPFDTLLGRLAGLVCYDLRFPELTRCQAARGATLLLVAAQWPLGRLDHWRTLIRARAMENQLFVLAANRCGVDSVAGGITYGGHSMIVGPDGTVLYEAGEAEEQGQVRLDAALVDSVRAKFNSVAPSPFPGHDSDKIVGLNSILKTTDILRKTGLRIVFTNGCFDILHSGHASYLEAARRQGDCLIVGLNSDISVRSIKGTGRPVNDETERARVLAALGCVDYIVLFDEDTPHKLITAIMPDVLAKGADWQEHDIVGAKEIKAAGGRVARIPLKAGASTTSLIKKIKNGRDS